jgi:DNA-binding XRE family transcriptional regulator
MRATGERLHNIHGLRVWTQARSARESGVDRTTVFGIETGKIGRPHFGPAVHGALSVVSLSLAPWGNLFSPERRRVYF